MHFKNLYPNVKTGFKPTEYPGLKKVSSKHKSFCFFCRIPTDWFDHLTQSYTCSKKCFNYTREKEWFGK